MNEHDIHAKQIRKHNLVMWGFLGFIAYLLIAEHWAHNIPLLPYVILLLCPLMYIFMHSAHGDHHKYGSHNHHSEHRED